MRASFPRRQLLSITLDLNGHFQLCESTSMFLGQTHALTLIFLERQFAQTRRALGLFRPVLRTLAG